GGRRGAPPDPAPRDGLPRRDHHGGRLTRTKSAGRPLRGSLPALVRASRTASTGTSGCCWIRGSHRGQHRAAGHPAEGHRRRGGGWGGGRAGGVRGGVRGVVPRGRRRGLPLFGMVMKLTRAAVYALTALAHLARNGEGRPVASHDVAAAEDIPERFLLKLLK